MSGSSVDAYPTYPDGEPVDNEMRDAAGDVWFRLKNGDWACGSVSGPWPAVERQYGPFTRLFPATPTV